MNKVVLASICFAAGAGFGFGIGYYLGKKNTDDKQLVEPIYIQEPEQEEEKPEEKPKKIPGDKMEEFIQKTVGEGSLYNDIFKSKAAKIATKPGEVGINYAEYAKELKYKQESQVPPDDDPEAVNEGDDEDDIDMSRFEETYEERIEREAEEALEQSERYKAEHKGKIELMTSDEWDTDFPMTDYEREDLYYFTESDILTDENGSHLNEKEFIGPKVRQVGWMQSPDECIYIRNHPKEKEFRVFKERCSVEDWF